MRSLAHDASLSPQDLQREKGPETTTCRTPAATLLPRRQPFELFQPVEDQLDMCNWRLRRIVSLLGEQEALAIRRDVVGSPACARGVPHTHRLPHPRGLPAVNTSPNVTSTTIIRNVRAGPGAR